MDAVKGQKKKKRIEWNIRIPDRYLLLLVSLGCIALIVLTYIFDFFSGPLNLMGNYIIVPFQEGISAVGSWIVDETELLTQLNTVMEENKQLKAENEALVTENTNLQQDKYELQRLQELYELDSKYDQYEKTGARIIARDSGNWYHCFVINKGEEDGLELNMNVIAGSGLVGRITSIGPGWAKVDSIINDSSNVTGSVLSTSDNLIVSGDLTLYERGVIRFSRLSDPDNEVSVGDKVVTSNISDIYLPGILIGYITELQTDSNNLTKSGTITPAVDFEDLDTVLVILEKKKTAE